MARQESGFTLIEVMIVVVIIAILAAIAIPSYNDYVTRGRIIEATAGLGDARSKMEQYYQDNRTYPTSCQVPPATLATGGVMLSQLQNFTLTCTFADLQSYSVAATGNTGGTMDGWQFTINQQNNRATVVTGVAATKGWTGNTGCWVIRKGGTCS